MLKSSDNTSWYTGMSVLGFLKAQGANSDDVLSLPFRLSVARIADIEAGIRGFSGSIVSGVIRPGDDVRVQPSGSTGRVAQVLTPDGAGVDRADAGQTGRLMLEGDLVVSRGDLISGIDQPAHTAD
ncbi:hypothetical protein [Vreelandella janggokensis]|uniref:hypothetical protein n=1 Tax=Vreelandella janggokensis TaxID=370767 RepID=UPI00285C1408|nr:hypothetical protein [Halomonas janggokensis]MDR5887791.1 hypothetical protein [Halomonas janggokensis]